MQYKVFGNPFPAVSVRMDRGGEHLYPVRRHELDDGCYFHGDEYPRRIDERSGTDVFGGLPFYGNVYRRTGWTGDHHGVIHAWRNPCAGDFTRNTYIAQKGAFLCAQHSVELDAVLTKKISSGMFGGEGFILQRLSGNGMAFLELDGTVCEYELAPGQKMKIDSGNVAYFEERVKYSIEMVKGFSNIFFGGEGLFLTVLEGPGKVWLQTMTASELANKIIPYIPTSGK